MCKKGSSVIELLVSISIISILFSILVPVIHKARGHAKSMLGMNNQRQIINAANIFATNNDKQYPKSVATTGNISSYWHWQEPLRITASQPLSPQRHRAMSEYLGSYIEDASILFCPNAPRKYKYFQEAWQAGDNWDNPETDPAMDPVSGTYCFWWNYTGYLSANKKFLGPKNYVGQLNQSKLLVSCYFGYSHWRSPKAFGSCERFKNAYITPETYVSSAYWSSSNYTGRNIPKLKFHAGFIDGHVETFPSSKVIPMAVSNCPDGTKPYLLGIGPGIFYLPEDAVK